MAYKILEFATEAGALAKSAEYFVAPEGSVSLYRWGVIKHPSFNLWAVQIEGDEAELSEADFAQLKDEWAIENDLYL